MALLGALIGLGLVSCSKGGSTASTSTTSNTPTVSASGAAASEDITKGVVCGAAR